MATAATVSLVKLLKLSDVKCQVVKRVTSHQCACFEGCSHSLIKGAQTAHPHNSTIQHVLKSVAKIYLYDRFTTQPQAMTVCKQEHKR